MARRDSGSPTTARRAWCCGWRSRRRRDSGLPSMRGPRRLVHGVLGTLFRRGIPPMDSPRLPEAVEQRWAKAWGDNVVASARRLIAKRPPLDLSVVDDAEAQSFAESAGGKSLARLHVRLRDAGAVSK